ncbi:MAG: hypothetical protein JSR19_08845 [Proteobacteria bacterium]|nr:hypothetical protein [Pseudomonadota bacterium]HQR04452.1 TorF family putative porin [Rhodocyclaceae bacterium]
MKIPLITAAIIGMIATPAFADDAPASPLSFNVGVVTDYLFRGVSQTHGDGALQAGVDYAFSNGFYVGAWASSISWVKDYTGKGTTEVDIYGGYRNAFAGGDWNYDVGLITYNYPGHGAANAFGANPNTTEVYGALGYKEFSVKYSHAVSSHFIGWYSSTGGGTRGSGYLEGNWAHDLGDGWGVSAHIGHQRVRDLSIADYTDWNVGVTKDVGFGVIGLTYSDTNTSGSCDSSAGGTNAYCWGNNGFMPGIGATSGFRNVSKGTALLTFKKTF